MKSTFNINLQNLTYALVISVLTVYIIIVAKVVLVPIVYSVLLSLMLKPIADFFESKVSHRGLSIFLTTLVGIIPLSGIVLFFTSQSISLFRNLPSIQDRLNGTVDSIFKWSNEKFQLDIEAASQWVSDNITTILDIPVSFIRGGIESTTIVLANVVLVIVMTFFMLLYRSAFKNFFLIQFNKGEGREQMDALFNKIQHITQHYLFGLGLVIIILGIMIGLGLWFIGVPYAFFWGFLAAMLGIIPYIGTTIGGVLPFLYMIAVSGNLWQPLAVVGLYIFVQQIEGNFITPNVMGSSIKINPLFAIVGLFIGGVLWGISGMILALPLIAVTKEVLRNFKYFTPMSYLMGSNLVKNATVFHEQFDDDKYRFLNLLFQKPESKKERNDKKEQGVEELR